MTKRNNAPRPAARPSGQDAPGALVVLRNGSSRGRELRAGQRITPEDAEHRRSLIAMRVAVPPADAERVHAELVAQFGPERVVVLPDGIVRAGIPPLRDLAGSPPLAEPAADEPAAAPRPLDPDPLPAPAAGGGDA